MALRAFAAHPAYRRHPDALAAATLLKSRFFLADRYNDRKGPEYWLKFGYPFWWTSLLTALDSLSRMGFPADDPDARRGLAWLLDNQGQDGLWEHGYGARKGARANRLWVGLAICRVPRSFFDSFLESDGVPSA